MIGVLFALSLLAGGGNTDAGAALDRWSVRLQQAYATASERAGTAAATPPATQAAPGGAAPGPVAAKAVAAAGRLLARGLAAYRDALVPNPPTPEEPAAAAVVGPLLAKGAQALEQAAMAGLGAYRTVMPKTPPPLQAEPHSPALASLVSEASNRFDLPEPWISAVMQVESNGTADATSPKGAMGLMQVMPATYAYLSDRYSLGDDPYAPRDNLLAGSAYLRELYDRYGAAGFLAAYNAGPGRYEDSLCRGCSLPEETRRYVASVRLAVGETLFGQPHSRFYQPIAVAPNGAMLLARTGEAMPVAERLALHSLIERAVRQAGAK